MSEDWSFASQVPSGESLPPRRAAAPPTVIEGKLSTYRLVSRLGSGGAGEVYRAVDRDGRQVAIKLLVRSDDPSYAERFTREGRMAASIMHPNVITIHESGSHAGQPFLVCELVEGARTFAEALRDLHLPDRLDLVAQVIDGVAAAHHLGLIHRDLKPENILLGEDGRARVTDFGLGLGEQDRRLTQSGALVGTPRVMAPEQIRGDRAAQGAPTDVWALGVLLYQALTDRPPFNGKTLAELLAQITNKAPESPRRVNRSVSASLERVCLRALAKRPEDRYSDAGQMGRALHDARAPRRPGRASLLVTVAATLTVVAGGAVLAWVRRAPGSPPTPAPAASPTTPVAAAGDAGLLAGLAEVEQAFEDKRYERSLKLVEELLLRYPRSLEARLCEGEILAQLKRFGPAASRFESILEGDPKNVRGLVGLGVSRSRLGRIEEGLAILDRALAIDPSWTDALEKRSLVNYQRRAYNAALEDAQRALELSPNSAEALNCRGLALCAMSNTAGAIADFKAALAIDFDPYVLANLGAARLDHGDRVQGVKDLRRAVELVPDHGPAWSSLAVDYLDHKLYPEALEAFERALRGDPDDPHARFGRGVTLERLGREKEALAEAEWLIRKHPQHPDTAQARKMRKSLLRRAARRRQGR